MKVLILYFSLTDRTKLVSEVIAAELSNHEVDIKSISYTKGRKIPNFQEEAEKVCADVGGIVIENYGYDDERIVFDSECG